MIKESIPLLLCMHLMFSAHGQNKGTAKDDLTKEFRQERRKEGLKKLIAAGLIKDNINPAYLV